MSELKEVDKDGIIFREENGSVVVQAYSSEWCEEFGATCLNPKAKPEQRIYQRVFQNKPIFFPEHYDEAIKYCSPTDAFSFSMNGYSRLEDDFLTRYDVKKMSYEYACMRLLKEIIRSLHKEFPEASLFMPYGAADTGVDWAIEQVALLPEFKISLLGFSCPNYMLYVKDDHIPVYVGKNKKAYSDLYVESINLLFNTGGRETALEHDIVAACRNDCKVHFIDLINLLTDCNVPATIIDESGKRRIENAPAVFGNNVSFSSASSIVSMSEVKGSKWDNLFNVVNGIAKDTCRNKLPVEMMF